VIIIKVDRFIKGKKVSREEVIKNKIKLSSLIKKR